MSRRRVTLDGSAAPRNTSCHTRSLRVTNNTRENYVSQNFNITFVSRVSPCPCSSSTLSLFPGNISAMPVSTTVSSERLAAKRALSDTESDTDEPQSKRMKTPVASGSSASPVKDKKKKRSKKKKRKTPVVAGGMKTEVAGPSTARAGITPSAPVSAARKPLSSQGPAYETPQEHGDLLGELPDAMVRRPLAASFECDLQLIRGCAAQRGRYGV